MDGVEIINIICEYERLIDPLWGLGFSLICLVIAIIGMCTVHNDTIQKRLKIIIAPFLIAMLACFVGVSIKTDKVSEIKYEVVITDQISITEFESRYEIVGQRSENIFLVKEKENNG